ncbi:hypothetical protein MRX96_013294 [Rhipicephalus microplus]
MLNTLDTPGDTTLSCGESAGASSNAPAIYGRPLAEEKVARREKERLQRAPPKSHRGGHRAARQVQAPARHVFSSGGSTGPAVNGCESSPPSTQLPLRTPDVASVPLAAF